MHSVGLAESSFGFFHTLLTEKPKWPFWPVQDRVNLPVTLETSLSDDVFVTTQPSLWSNSQIRICLLERKPIALTIWTFVSKMMSLLFNTLSRFVIAFLPRSKHLLISWLWLPSAVILEPQKIKSVIVSTFFPLGSSYFFLLLADRVALDCILNAAVPFLYCSMFGSCTSSNRTNLREWTCKHVFTCLKVRKL